MGVFRQANQLDTYRIRFNTASTSDEKCWRIITSNGLEFLVNSIDIQRECKTTKDWMDETQEFKYHITTRGVLYIDDKKNAIIGS
jgi:hypothetical protein